MIELSYIAMVVLLILFTKVFFDLDRLKNLSECIDKDLEKARKDIENLDCVVKWHKGIQDTWIAECRQMKAQLKAPEVITIGNVKYPKDFGKVKTGEIKVNNLHDDHYKKLGIEPWDILKANMTYEEYKGFLKGNIQKYLHRNKEGLKDYEKLANYANKLVETVKENEQKHGNNTSNSK